MEVEWLAVSGFGFHGSKPSLLYYGQPLTTAGMQRFASSSLYESVARSFHARFHDRRRIFLSAHLTPVNFHIEINLNPAHHGMFQISVGNYACMRQKCNENLKEKKI